LRLYLSDLSGSGALVAIMVVLSRELMLANSRHALRRNRQARHRVNVAWLPWHFLQVRYFPLLTWSGLLVPAGDASSPAVA
jgi:hypothetical protein